MEYINAFLYDPPWDGEIFFVESTLSCGVSECYNLHKNPELVVATWQRSYKGPFHPGSAFIIWADMARVRRRGEQKSRGHLLKDYVEKHKLGTVMVSDKSMNDNSGNYNEVFVCIPDKKAILAWKPEESLPG